MGCKVHPIGLRLGIHRKWKSNWYFDSKNYTKFLHLNFDIEKYFKGFLYYYSAKSLLINCQVIKLPSNQIFIFVFFYRLRKRFKKTKNSAWKIKYWKLNIRKTLINKHKEKLPFIYAAKQFNKKEFFNFLNNAFIVKKNPKYILTKNQNDLNLENIYKFYFLFKNYYNIILKIKNTLKIKLLNVFLIKLFFKLNYLQKFNLLINFLFNKKLTNNIILNLWIKKTLYFLNTKKYLYNQYNYINILNNNINIKNDLKKVYLIKCLKQYTNFYKNNNIIDKNNKIIRLKKNLWKKNTLNKKKTNIFFKKNIKILLPDIKKFLSLITNSKINLIFINSLSFCKFYYFSQKKKKKTDTNERFNLWPLERYLFNRYKYSAIYIKDFIHLSFITVLIKNPQVLVNFIGHQFKHLPKNRKQLKLLSFITQTIKIVCELRREIIGFKLQIKGRLNRRNRTKTYNFKKGIMPIQTINTRVEYGYSEGFTRTGLIGIKFWIFYQKNFKDKIRIKFLEYFLYSKYKLKFNYLVYIKKFLNLKKNK